MRSLHLKIHLSFLVIASCFILVGCGGDDGPRYQTPEQQAGTAAVGEPAAPGISNRPASNARLTIIKPAAEEVLENTRADIFFQTQNFEIGDGNAIMVVLDNQSPRRHAVRNAPYVITGLSEGGHTVQAFLVGPDGLIVNSPDAKATVHFYVKRKDFQNFLGSGDTAVTINQPRGRYVGARADNVILDFKVSNPPPGYMVRYTVDGQTQTLNSDAPVLLPGLSAGSQKVVVEILDAQGNPLPSSFAKAQSNFEIVRNVSPPPVSEPVNTSPPSPVSEGNFQDTPPPAFQTPPTPQSIPE